MKQIFLVLCMLWLRSCYAAPIGNVSSLITNAGYPAETHLAETSDGFFLSIIRIPYGRGQQPSPRGSKPAVFLQHGLLDSACAWVVNSPNESLAFILADAGFDVYLGNVRGNSYSSQNAYYSIDTKAFWDLVDFDNMIAIDLPTMVNKALEISGRTSLVYVGHSQGTIMGFGAFPLQPDLAAKVDIFIALAPVAWVSHQESLVLSFLADLDLAEWLYLFGELEFLPADSFLEYLAGALCGEEPYICEDIVFSLCGVNWANLNSSRMPVYMEHTPAGTSVRNMLHWTQLVNSGNFQMFDYGTSAGNMQHYNQSTPPQYAPQNLIHPPVALFTGSMDDLADPTDVQTLLNALPQSNQPVVVLNEPLYEHLDFTWGENAHIEIYPTVLKLAIKYSSM